MVLPKWMGFQMDLYAITEKQARTIPHTLKVLVLFTVVGGILFARYHTAYLYPVLHCEDGWWLVGNYIFSPQPEPFWRYYNGYISLLPNVVAYLASLFLTGYMPYVLVGYAFVISVACYSILYLRRFRPLIPDDKLRAAICILVAFAPLGNHALLAGTAYSLWPSFGLMLLLIWASPVLNSHYQLSWHEKGLFVLLVLFIFTHPLSVLALPICVYHFMFNQQPSIRIFHGGLIIAILSYVFVVFHLVPEVHRGVPMALQLSGQKLQLLGEIFLERIVFEALFGSGIRLLLLEAEQHSIIYFTGIGVATLLLVWTGRILKHLSLRAYLNIALVIGFLIIYTLLLILMRGLDANFVNSILAQRYVYLQQMLFLAVLISAFYYATTQMKFRLRWQLSGLLIFLLITSIGNITSTRLAFVDTSRTSINHHYFVRHVSLADKTSKIALYKDWIKRYQHDGCLYQAQYDLYVQQASQ